MHRIEQFSKSFRRLTHLVFSLQMGTSDHDKDLPATVLHECALKAGAKSPAQRANHLFELVGRMWHLRYGKEEGDFPKFRFKGMAFVAKLLASPNRLISAFDLEGNDRVARSIRSAEELDESESVAVQTVHSVQPRQPGSNHRGPETAADTLPG
jgi:hypothetical protein